MEDMPKMYDSTESHRSQSRDKPAVRTVVAFTYSPKDQLRVLKVIEAECGLHGTIPKTDILIDGIGPDQISFYCELLADLGFIKCTFLEDYGKRVYFPVRLKVDGDEFLRAADPLFWQAAEDAVTSSLGKLLPIDVAPFLKFFRAAWSKYQNEKSGA
jgi:hypothetical protein